MATLTMTPTRQPFASLDTPRMRPIMRSKLNRQNVQNGAILSQKSSVFINEDSENIDPYTRSLSAKRKRAFDDDEVSKGSPKPLKTSRIALTTRTSNIQSRDLSTPLKHFQSTPKSAPTLKPAGRTPPPKSSKSSGRRSIAKARPEAKRAVARPFSLATALAQSTPAPKPQTKQPAGWFFDIHVDSEQEEMTNLMQHSTGVLDISDDEGKASATNGRGKENVPPAELGIDLPRSPQAASLAATAAARKAEKMEEDRSPLGELAPSDYYPEDCNAFSYAVVYDDDIAEAKKMGPPQSIFVPPAITTSIASLLETALPPAFAEKPKEQTEKTTDETEVEAAETVSEKDH